MAGKDKDARSTRSLRSLRSHTSCLSLDVEAVLALKKTKAQAARTRAQYALQQAKIQKEKAQLDVDLDVLNAEIEHAAAVAEVFLDILNEIESLKLQAPYRSMLAGYDTLGGLLPIMRKLPYKMQEKWVAAASRYKMQHRVPFPPFSVFCQFIQEFAGWKMTLF